MCMAVSNCWNYLSESLNSGTLKYCDILERHIEATSSHADESEDLRIFLLNLGFKVVVEEIENSSIQFSLKDLYSMPHVTISERFEWAFKSISLEEQNDFSWKRLNSQWIQRQLEFNMNVISPDFTIAKNKYIFNQPYSKFGHSMTMLKSSNRIQIAISAPMYSTATKQNCGAVFIAEFNDFMAGLSTDIELISFKIIGEIPFSQFGYSLASVDLNKDGLADLIVGSPVDHSAAIPSFNGRLRIFYGSKDGIYSADKSSLIESDEKNSLLGFKLFSFDLDNDGFNDLIISCPHSSLLSKKYQSGAVYCILSSTFKTFLSANLNQVTSWKLAFPDEIHYGFEWFGYSISYSRPLLAIGAPGYSSHPDYPSVGAAYVYEINENGQIGKLFHKIEGNEKFDRFAESIAISVISHRNILLWIGAPAVAIKNPIYDKWQAGKIFKYFLDLSTDVRELKQTISSSNSESMLGKSMMLDHQDRLWFSEGSSPKICSDRCYSSDGKFDGFGACFLVEQKLIVGSPFYSTKEWRHAGMVQIIRIQ